MAQKNATYCIDSILKDEGGYVNNPNDKGGPTNKGITLTNFRRYIKPSGTIEDLKNLTTAQARDVYRQQYWNAVRADELPSGVDYAVCDFAVHSGPVQAIKYLQRTLAQMGLYKGGIDGRIGPMTMEAVRVAKPRVLINTICDLRMAFLKRLSSWKHFTKGWTNRVSGVRADSLSLTTAAVGDDTPEPAPAKPKTFWDWLMELFGKRS